MALTHEFCTLADLKTELGLSGNSEDTLLERIIKSISSQVARYMGRPLYWSQSVTDQPLRQLSARRLEVIPRWGPLPVVTITDIKLDGAALDETLFGSQSELNGVLWYDGTLSRIGDFIGNIERDRFPGNQPTSDLGTGYTMSWTGGWVTEPQGGTVTLPADICDAVLEAAAWRYRRQGSDPRIQQESLLQYSVAYSVAGALNTWLTASVRSVLDQYRIVAQC